MKKTAAMILALVLTLSLSAAAMAEDTYRVGICQLVQHVALDAATQGFQDALKEKLGDKVTFDVQNASGDSNTCSTIVNNFISGGVNLIMRPPGCRGRHRRYPHFGHQRDRLRHRPGYRRLERGHRHERVRHQRPGSPGTAGQYAA